MKKFNLLTYLLPPEEKIFYKLFEDAVNTSKESAVLLNEIVTSNLNEERIKQARELKHKSNAILKNTLRELNKTFVTPVEPEDIQNVASFLNKITKKIIKVCLNLRIYRLDKFSDSLIKQSETLIKATEELEYIIKKFKKVSSVQKITVSNLRMKEIETKGDEILFGALDELFSGSFDALEVIKLKDIYKDLENALDGCFTVSDIIVNIVLKQS